MNDEHVPSMQEPRETEALETAGTTPRRMKQPSNPWGREHPNRGIAHITKAVALSQRFGIDGTRNSLADLDAYLIEQGEMQGETGRAERNEIRNRFVKQVRQSSVSKRMAEHGIKPFDIVSTPQGWRLESIAKTVERRSTAKKLASQARTSARRQRHYMQSLDPVQDWEAYTMGAITGQVTNVMQQVMRTMDDAIGKAHQELHAVFANIHKLEGRADRPTLAEPELPPSR